MDITTDAPDATLEALLATFSRIYPGGSATLLPVVFRDVCAMFAGEYLDYQRNDTPYHDLRHTLAVTRCFAEIVEGQDQAGATPVLTPRQMELGLAASLLHDTGYLKLRSDLKGTGAKYTFTHVLRSCAVASSYLPPMGVTLEELDDVLGAIRCTTPGIDVSVLTFKTDAARVVGLAVATADYIGQMAAPDYVESLPKLFAEFEESDNYSGVPESKRSYRSAADLIASTPEFWENTVKPRLEQDLAGQYRYLARPSPHGPNRALAAIEANIQRIRAKRCP